MATVGAVGASALGISVTATGAAASDVTPPAVTRISGADRYDTAVQASAATFGTGVDVVYLATGQTFPDALAASAASGGHGPVLLTTPSALPALVGSELTRLHPGRVVVVGGTASVTDAVANAAGSVASASVTRIAGNDRYATAAALSAATFPTATNIAYLAAGGSFADALAAGAAAAGAGPVLLTPGDALAPSTAAELQRLRPQRLVVLGGSAVVSDAVFAAAEAAAQASTSRIGGADRYATAAALSGATFDAPTESVYVATGTAWPDALAAGAVAAHHGSPLLLDNPVAPPTDVLDELHRLAPSSLIAVGGTAALSAANLDALTGVVTSDTTTAPAGGSSGGGAPAPAPTAAPAPSTTNPYAGRVGLSSHVFWMNATDAQAQLATMAAGGVRQVREDFEWGTIQPAAGQWDWTHPDNMMTAASRAGVGVLAILDYSALWASSGPDRFYPPASNAAFATYAAAVAGRYGPGGTFWTSHTELAPQPLDGLEIWNEPWGFWFWKSNPNPTAYAALARAAAVAIRQANSGVKILIAADVLQVRTDGAIVNWFDNVLNADPGLGQLVDGYTVHPYPDPRTKGPMDDSGDIRWNFARVTLVHTIAVAHGADHPIWITEVGWTTAAVAGQGVSEATQAQYLHDAITRSIGSWGSYVARIYLYTWGTSSASTTDLEGNYALQRSDGSFKPAWAAITGLLQ